MAGRTFKIDIAYPAELAKTFSGTTKKLQYGQFSEKYGFLPGVQMAVEKIYDAFGFYPNDDDLVEYKNPSTLNLYLVDYVSKARSAAEAASAAASVASTNTTRARDEEKKLKQQADQDAAKAASRASTIASAKESIRVLEEKTARANAQDAAQIAQSVSTQSPTIYNDVNQAATATQQAATMDNQLQEVQELPEVQVKSDFKKYLLIGGGVLLAYYLLMKKKK